MLPHVCLQQCFSTFFDSQYPSFVIKQFGGTPSYNLSVASSQIHKQAAPLDLFIAPKRSTAPRLRSTGLQHKLSQLYLYDMMHLGATDTIIEKVKRQSF